MIGRFEGANNPQRREALARQELTMRDPAIVAALDGIGKLEAFADREVLIREGDEDTANDVFFILAGEVSVVIKGQQVRTLSAGCHVGEMAAIDAALKRSATVTAIGTVVTLRVPAIAFVELCDQFPKMWKPLACACTRRLHDRNRLMRAPNDKPKIFIMSSSEAVFIAHAIRDELHGKYDVRPWTQGVFYASTYPLIQLEEVVEQSDYGVAIAQADDITRSRGKSHQSPRDNVLFELGMFVGHLGKHRTVLAHPNAILKLPSDLSGLTHARYTAGDKADVGAWIDPVCREIEQAVERHGVRTGPRS